MCTTIGGRWVREHELCYTGVVPLGMLLIASSGPNWEEKMLPIAQPPWKIVSVGLAKSRVVFIFLILFKPFVFENRKLLLLCKKEKHNKLIIIAEVANIQVVQ